MSSFRFIAATLALGLSLPPVGCGLFRRRNNTTTNVSSNVQVNQQGRDISTLTRDEYDVIHTSMGTDKSRLFYILTIPVGSQTTSQEGEANAYYDAVDKSSECDALMLPRVDTKRSIIPLLLINIVIRKTQVKGRCIHIKEGEGLYEARGADLEDDGGSDTGGGGEPAPEPEPEPKVQASDGGDAPAPS